MSRRESVCEFSAPLLVSSMCMYSEVSALSNLLGVSDGLVSGVRVLSAVPLLNKALSSVFSKEHRKHCLGKKSEFLYRNV